MALLCHTATNDCNLSLSLTRARAHKYTTTQTLINKSDFKMAKQAVAT
jgi:hypothetical protein